MVADTLAVDTSVADIAVADMAAGMTVGMTVADYPFISPLQKT